MTATDLLTIYRDAAASRSFRQEDLLRLARSAQQEITFQRFDGFALSAADAFSLLTEATAAFIERRQWPADTQVMPLYGPARAYVPPNGGVRSSSFRWSAFARAVRDTADFCRTAHRLPDEIWIGAESLSPADYLATLAQTVESVMASGTVPTEVVRRDGRYTADRYVADDSPRLWGWVIFPPGFSAPGMMDLAKRQAWTVKPAILHAGG